MATFVESIFGKQADKLTLEDVQNFFKERQEETATLEFKSGDLSLDKLFKSVAGFLNSEGGLLIIGAPQEREHKINEHQRVRYAQGELILCTTFKTRESITQKLGSNIVPPPAGIKITPFYTDKGAVYLVEVPQSVSPPHQVQQSGMYYFRNDNTTVPASHGVVSALFNQRRTPRLVAYVDWDYKEGYSEMDVNISLQNESEYPADKVGYMVNIYNGFNIKGNIRLEFKPRTHTEFQIKELSAVFAPDMVIPRGVGSQQTFKLEHRYNHIVISVLHWSVQNTTRGLYLWIDCSTGKIVESTSEPEEGVDMLERYFTYLKEDPTQRIVVPNMTPDANAAYIGGERL